MIVPEGGFGKRLDDMHEWHGAHGLRAKFGRSRRDKNNRDYVTWSFAEGNVLPSPDQRIVTNYFPHEGGDHAISMVRIACVHVWLQHASILSNLLSGRMCERLQSTSLRDHWPEPENLQFGPVL
jgi:hypothetical protein